MGQGLRVWDENGVNLVDTDYRMTQIIGSVYTANFPGRSIHVPEFATLAGTPFVLNIPNTSSAAAYVRIEGHYVKWGVEGGGSGHSWIIWGVY